MGYYEDYVSTYCCNCIYWDDEKGCPILIPKDISVSNLKCSVFEPKNDFIIRQER